MELIDIKNMRVEGSNVLGSSMKVLVRLNTTPSTITITIEAPSVDSKVSDVAMTAESPYIYYYIFTSSNTYVEGDYIFRVTATDSSGTCIKEGTWQLLKPFNTSLL